MTAPSENPSIRIQMLGPFRVWRDDKLLQGADWTTQRCRTLLKILLTERGHTVQADRLMDYLWPDLPLEKAKNNLWVTISQLRRVLQPGLKERGASDFVIKYPDGYALSLSADTWVDLDNFNEQLEKARAAATGPEYIQALESARKLYKGDFLEEDRYEDWAAPLRERIKQEYLSKLDDLADVYAHQGRYSLAIQLCQEGLYLDNTREETYRNLMKYYHYSGEPASVFKLYEECRRILMVELGVEPAEETQNLYRQILRQQNTASETNDLYPVPSTLNPLTAFSQTSFVGRTKEFDHLSSLVKGLISNQGWVVFIEGEPGVGKSRLVQEVIDDSWKRGVRTIVVKCYQIEQSTPFQPVIDLVDTILHSFPDAVKSVSPTYLSDLAALEPAILELIPDLSLLPSGLDESRQARLFNALLQLLVAVAVDNGLLLAIDDLQWADQATMKFLYHLARGISNRRIILVGTLRGEDVSSSRELAGFIQSLRREQHLHYLRLERLRLEDIHRIVRPICATHQQADELSGWLFRETDGNPFYLVTTLQSLQEKVELDDQGILPADVDLGLLYEFGTPLTLPAALQDSVRSRLNNLTPLAHKTLEYAAVIGRRFEFDTLLAITQVNSSELVESMEDLLQRRLLREVGDGFHYDFSHDKIREVVYLDLSSIHRRLLHSHVAERLENKFAQSLDEYTGMLAEHFEHGGNWEKAVYYLYEAGDRSSSLFAMPEALRFYDRAIQIIEGHPQAVSPAWLNRVYEKRGQARAQAGEFMAAIADLDIICNDPALIQDPDHEADLRTTLGMVFRRIDDYEHARKQLLRALEIARACKDEHRLANILYHLGTVAWTEGNNRLSMTFHEEAEEICQRLNLEDLVAVQAYHGRGENFLNAGECLEAIEYFLHSLELARKIGDKAYEAENLYMLAASTNGFASANYGRAYAFLQQSLEISQAAFMLWHEMPAHFILTSTCAGLGMYGDAFSHANQALEIAESLKTPYFHSIALDFLGGIYQDLNLLYEAEETHAYGVEIARQAHAGNWLPRIKANLAIDRLRLGDLQVEELLQEAVEETLANRQELHTPLALQGLAELSILRNNPDQALSYAEQLMGLSEPRGMRENIVQAWRWRAQAMIELGNVRQARKSLKEAALLASEIGKPRLLWDIHTALVKLYTVLGEPENVKTQKAMVNRQVMRIAASLSDPELKRGLPAVQD